MPKAAIYTRVSTEDQAKEGYSLDAQKERLISYCEAQGWDVGQIYEENGHSGRNTKRPAYRQMMEEKDTWDIILVMKMDRIHRNSKNFMIMMENLEKWGKKFTSMNESLDTSNAVGRFVVDIIQRIAQLESEQIGERTYMGMRQKAESLTGTMGFNAPFGYRIEGEKLALVPEEGVEVCRAYQDYLSGKTMEQIARDLNERCILTRRGGIWTIWSVSRLLHNPVYAGYLRWDGLLLPSGHEPAVDIALFNSVQYKMATQVKAVGSKNYLHLGEHLDAIKISDLRMKIY